MGMKINDEELAYHEAGHAAMSIVLGSSIEFVTIDKAGDLDGLMDPGQEFRNLESRPLTGIENFTYDEKILLRNYIKVIYAGPMAHGLFLKNTEWWNYLDGGNDSLHAFSLLEKISIYGPVMMKLQNELKTEAMIEMAKPETWEKVKIIACGLLEKRRLTREECILLISNANSISK
jgi:hypothetical protein